MVCPPVRGDNPRALASGLSLVQADKPWYNYFIPLTTVKSEDFARYKIFHDKDGWMDDLRFYVLFNSISVISG